MLGECHAHVIMDGKNYKEAVSLHKNGVVEEVIHNCFRDYKEAGIEFIRDGGDSYNVSKRAKEIAAELGIDFKQNVPDWELDKEKYQEHVKEEAAREKAEAKERRKKKMQYRIEKRKNQN